MKENVVVRNSNIELLRILAMVGVIILHYNNSDIGGGLAYVEQGTLSYYLLYVLESISICAVDLFIMISGYFMCNSYNRPLMKPLKLLVQVIVFKEAGAVLSLVVGIVSGAGSFSVKGLVYKLLEAAVPNNYFVILYIALYFISVYINLAIKALDLKGLRRMLILLMILFSVWVTLVDILNGLTNTEWSGLSTVGIDGDMGGYTIINFVLMYFIGAYMRIAPPKHYAVKKVVLIYVILIVIITLWALSFHIPYFDISGSAWTYCNPFVILSAILLFQIFKQMPERKSGFINAAAKGCFTVFLGHTFFLPYISIQKFCHMPWIILLIHVVISSIVIYGLCWTLYFIYDKISSCIFRHLADCNVLSKSIVYTEKRGRGSENS